MNDHLELPDNTHRLTKPNYRHTLQGMQVYCVSDDLKYISKQLSRIGFKGINNELITGYNRAFVDAYKQETNTAKKEGAARFCANTWLRADIDRRLRNWK